MANPGLGLGHMGHLGYTGPPWPPLAPPGPQFSSWAPCWATPPAMAMPTKRPCTEEAIQHTTAMDISATWMKSHEISWGELWWVGIQRWAQWRRHVLPENPHFLVFWSWGCVTIFIVSTGWLNYQSAKFWFHLKPQFWGGPMKDHSCLHHLFTIGSSDRSMGTMIKHHPAI